MRIRYSLTAAMVLMAGMLFMLSPCFADPDSPPAGGQDSSATTATGTPVAADQSAAAGHGEQAQSTAIERTLKLSPPGVVLKGLPFTMEVTVDKGPALSDGAILKATVDDAGGEKTFTGTAKDGKVEIADIIVDKSDAVVHVVDAAGQKLGSAEISTIPGWTTILPSLIAIVLAMTIRQVVPAMVLGIYVGAVLVHGSLSGLWFGILDTAAKYPLQALSDSGHLRIILFTMFIGGMVALVSRNGGTYGIVERVSKWAKKPRDGQVSGWFLGLVIFFDDYANSMIVGNTMRVITDKLRISREKLAYLVDSTSAPVASIAIVTTWIGFEVGLISTAVEEIHLPMSGYEVFLASMPYRFYAWLTIAFVFMVAWTGRDFGPMYKAELRARSTGQLTAPNAKTGVTDAEAEDYQPKPGTPLRAFNALIPVIVLVAGTMIGIYVTGKAASPADATLKDIIGNGDSNTSMAWASFIAVLVAAFLSRVQGILTIGEATDSWYAGCRTFLLAVGILSLRWSLSALNAALNTGEYLTSVVGSFLAPQMIPFFVFLIAAITAFATGTSWGVMGILIPLVVPLTWHVMEANHIADAAHYHVIYGSISGVLAGAIFGDHCSPISDTTILSATASRCDQIAHVATQLPYAVTVAVTAMLVCALPVGYGVPWWIMIPVAIALLFCILRFVGKRADDQLPVGALETPLPEEGITVAK